MPTRQQLEDKLTPAAKHALDELVEDYRAELLLRAGDSASRLGELREISVHDIVSAVGSRQRQLFGIVRSPLERILRIYTLIGALVGAVAFLWFLIEEVAVLSQVGSRLSLMAAAMGFIMAVVSYVLLRVRRQPFYMARREMDEERPREYHGLFLAQWSEVEMALRRMAAVRLGESASGGPILRLIERLGNEGVLSPDDHRQLQRILQLRNALAHGRPAATDQRQFIEVSREAERLLARLRGMS